MVKTKRHLQEFFSSKQAFGENDNAFRRCASKTEGACGLASIVDKITRNGLCSYQKELVSQCVFFLKLVKPVQYS